MSDLYHLNNKSAIGVCLLPEGTTFIHDEASIFKFSRPLCVICQIVQSKPLWNLEHYGCPYRRNSLFLPSIHNCIPQFELSLSADGSSSLLRSRSSILMTLMRIYTYEQRELLLRMPRIKISNGVQVTARTCCIWELDYVPVVDCNLKSVVSIG